jgi:thioredoxin
MRCRTGSSHTAAVAALPIEDAFERDVLASELPVLVLFHSLWCAACRWLRPTLEEIVAERAGALKLVTVSVDREPELAGRWGVRRIPTVVAFRDGREVARVVGNRRKSKLERALGLS